MVLVALTMLACAQTEPAKEISESEIALVPVDEPWVFGASFDDESQTSSLSSWHIQSGLEASGIKTSDSQSLVMGTPLDTYELLTNSGEVYRVESNNQGFKADELIVTGLANPQDLDENTLGDIFITQRGQASLYRIDGHTWRPAKFDLTNPEHVDDDFVESLEGETPQMSYGAFVGGNYWLGVERVNNDSALLVFDQEGAFVTWSELPYSYITTDLYYSEDDQAVWMAMAEGSQSALVQCDESDHCETWQSFDENIIAFGAINNEQNTFAVLLSGALYLESDDSSEIITEATEGQFTDLVTYPSTLGTKIIVSQSLGDYGRLYVYEWNFQTKQIEKVDEIQTENLIDLSLSPWYQN